jgi:hypothetical protein
MINYTFAELEKARIENNPESQQILDDNYKHFGKQDKLVLQILLLGVPLDVKVALVEYGIGDLRRRIKTLRDAGFKIQDKKQYKRFKIYYL